MKKIPMLSLIETLLIIGAIAAKEKYRIDGKTLVKVLKRDSKKMLDLGNVFYSGQMYPNYEEDLRCSQLLQRKEI